MIGTLLIISLYFANSFLEQIQKISVALCFHLCVRHKAQGRTVDAVAHAIGGLRIAGEHMTKVRISGTASDLCAALAGAKKEVCEALMQAATTDACLDILDQNGLREPVMHGLINAVQLHLERRAAGAFQVGAVLFSNQTGPLGQTETAEKLLQKWKES